MEEIFCPSYRFRIVAEIRADEYIVRDFIMGIK